MFTYFTHLECSSCDKTYETTQCLNLCSCGAPLLARYGLNKAADGIGKRNHLKGHPLWRYHAMLPVQSQARMISLGEGIMPLLRADRLGVHMGLTELYIKDESLNPSNIFCTNATDAAGVRAYLFHYSDVVACPTPRKEYEAVR